MGQVTVFSGPERRRRWSDEERLQILSEAFAPGACVAQVCRRHDISSALIYTWRRKLLDAGVEREAELPEALPTPVFAEALRPNLRYFSQNTVQNQGIARNRSPFFASHQRLTAI